jgi:tripartite-type tricarboxylate transporter receptor subunit TctC
MSLLVFLAVGTWCRQWSMAEETETAILQAAVRGISSAMRNAGSAASDSPTRKRKAMTHLKRMMRLAAPFPARDSAQRDPRKSTNPGVRLVPRTLCVVALALSAAWQAPAQAQAESFPSRPVKIIVPFVPGAAADALARTIANSLQAQWGQPVIVDNRPGGNTVIGTELVVRSPADGHTLLFTSDDTFTALSHLMRNLPFDPIKDLVPVNIPAKVTMLIVAHPATPADTLPAVIAHARAKPGALSYGSYGNGSNPHLMIETLKSQAKIDLLHVPYKGVAQAQAAVVGGEVQLSVTGYGTARGMIDAGRLKAIAVTGPERIPQLPNLPTTAELGYPDVDSTVWWGFAAPAKTPADIVNKINASISRALKSPELRKALEARALVELNLGPKEAAERIAREHPARAAVVRRSGAKLD